MTVKKDTNIHKFSTFWFSKKNSCNLQKVKCRILHIPKKEIIQQKNRYNHPIKESKINFLRNINKLLSSCYSQYILHISKHLLQNEMLSRRAKKWNNDKINNLTHIFANPNRISAQVSWQKGIWSRKILKKTINKKLNININSTECMCVITEQMRYFFWSWTKFNST